jgi:hypothetical protein
VGGQEHSEFLKSLVHQGHSTVQEHATTEKGRVLSYDNTDTIPENTPVITLREIPGYVKTPLDLARCPGADFSEASWYMNNKGYTQGIPMKLAVTKKLKKIADALEKLAMAASIYQVIYTEPNMLTLISKTGHKYTFTKYDVDNEKSFEDWLRTHVKDKENLGDTAIEDIKIQVFSEIKQGKKSFNVKFFNFPSDFKTPSLVY